MKQLLYLFISLMFVSLGCRPPTIEALPMDLPRDVLYTPQATTAESAIRYQDFSASDAINSIAAIENEYFNDINLGRVSKYYGTIWRQRAEASGLYTGYITDLEKRGLDTDSMHCTLYAFDGLSEGFSIDDLSLLMEQHRKIWKDREIAGWSLGYLLVKYWDWKAYLVLDESSHEYEHCLKAFEKSKEYPVWKQPNIPLTHLYIRGKDDEAISELLKEHPFAWGFSDQGYHTWITRFSQLKECNWAGSPANPSFGYGNNTILFIETPFLEYNDYQSHVIVVPPKIDEPL